MIRFLFLFLTVCLLQISISSAQEQVPNLATRRKTGRIHKEETGGVPDLRQLLILTRDNPEAYKSAKTAKAFQRVGSVVGFAGGFMVGYGLGAAITGEQITGKVIAVGGILVLGSVPFHIGSVTHARKAIKLYNTGMRQTTFKHIDLRVSIASNSLKLKVLF
jgi:hypothetical protein